MRFDKVVFWNFVLVIVIGSLIIIFISATQGCHAAFGDLCNDSRPDFPKGYVTDCNAIRKDVGSNITGIWLNCNSRREVPDVTIYNNGTPYGVEWALEDVENGLRTGNMIVQFPCSYPTEIKVYNNKIYGDLPTLVYAGCL